MWPVVKSSLRAIRADQLFKLGNAICRGYRNGPPWSGPALVGNPVEAIMQGRDFLEKSPISENLMNLNLEGLIPIAAGVYVSLMAFGVIPVKSEQFKQKFQTPMKWVGPACAVFGLLLLLRIL
jgi:hypothetical protein